MSRIRRTLVPLLSVTLCGGWLSMMMAGMARSDEIQWLRSAEKAGEVAAQSGKPILVYIRSSNCHYCDLMQTNVWQDPATVDTVMRDFVPLKLTREENPEAVKVLQVKGFPTTVIFSADRRYVDRLDGYVEADRFRSAVGKMQADVRR
ncbi:MAG: thioredoxin family protein [Aureliella sp.]